MALPADSFLRVYQSCLKTIFYHRKPTCHGWLTTIG